MTSQTSLEQRFTRVVIGARVGDAMGTPSEGMSPERIAAELGWITSFEGDGTDDSLMATILADTLNRTAGSASLDDWAERLLERKSEISGKSDKFFASVLHLVAKLRYGSIPSRVAKGNMASSSSAMCIWPVGLVNAGNPREASRQALELASLIHTDEVDACIDGAAAIAAAVAAAFEPDATVRTALEAAVAGVRRLSGVEMADAITRAIELADRSHSYESFREEYHATFRRTIICDSLETVPAALALCALADGDLRTVVEYGANFGRDTDTVASMSGAICGALADSIPSSWSASLSADELQSAERLGAALLHTGREKTARLRAELDRADAVWGAALA